MEKIKNKLSEILKFSEKIFKTDMKYLIKNSFWLYFGQAGASLISFVLIIAFAHFLTPEEYGTYKYIMSISSIILTLSLSGIGTSVVRSVSKNFEGSLKDGFKQSLRWGILTTVISFSIGIYYLINSNETLGYSLLIIGIFSPILNSASLYGSFLYGKQDFRRSTYYWLYTNLFSTLVIITTLYFVNNIIYIVLAYFLSNTLANLFFYFYIIKKYKPNEKTEVHTLKYGKHLSFLNVLETTAQQIDRILIFQFIGSAELAIYSLAMALPEQIRGGLKSISRIAFTKFSKKSIYELKKSIPYKSVIFGVLIIIIILLYIPTAPIFYNLFFPQYGEAIFYSQIISITLLGVVGTLPQTALQASRKTKELYIGNISTSIFQIIANVIMISQFGIFGTVFARILSKLFSTIVFFILLENSQETIPD